MIFGPHLQQRSHLWVHRGGPELVRVHLTQTFVAVDRHAALAGIEEVLDQLVERLDLDLFRLLAA